MSAEGSSSKADSAEKSEAMKKAAELMEKGKRNMVCGEVPKAVGLYEEAVKLLVDNCGELSRDCADAYFNCGSAVLELGLMETNVLGNALDGVEVEEEKEETTSEQFEKPPPDEDGEAAKDEAGEDTADDGEVEDAEVDGEEADGEEADGEEADGSQDGESQEGGSQDEKEQEKDGDDVGNFQLAWEYLECAKVIYLKSDTKEDQLKAAECYVKLGEISMETGQHPAAIEDLENAKKIQEKHLPEDDRILSQTYYTLGLACGVGKEFEQSIQHYQKAVDILQARIASLTKLVEKGEADTEKKEDKETDELKKLKDEIKDLNELIPDIRNKIEDTKIERKDMDKMKDMVKAVLGLGGTSSSQGFGSPTKKPVTAENAQDVDENGEKKASDIAHLVRKKRKPDEVEPVETDAKKLRQENGDSAVTINGNSEEKEEKTNGEKIDGHPEPATTDKTSNPEPMTT